MKDYIVRAGSLERKYRAGKPEVAAKRFLNYLRRYRKDRPTLLEVSSEGKAVRMDVSWYTGKLASPSFHGACGTWWKLEGTRQEASKRSSKRRRVSTRQPKPELIERMLDGTTFSYHGRCGFVFYDPKGKCYEPCPFPRCKFRGRRRR